MTLPKPRATHCCHGHPYSGSNLIITRNGRRRCRECQRVFQIAYNAKRRAHVRTPQTRIQAPAPPPHTPEEGDFLHVQRFASLALRTFGDARP